VGPRVCAGARSTRSAVPHIAFGGTNVVIHHLGREPLLANRNHAVFYDGGQRYLRRLADPLGDRCLFVELDPELAWELLGEDGFAFTHGPLPGRHRLLLELVARHPQCGGDDSATEAVVLEVVAAAAEAASQLTFQRPARPTTDVAHAGVVESAKEILASDPVAPMPLGALARRLHVSMFHLARMFRARTGFTLRGYRNHLRLRLELERLADPDIDLARLALDLGFASHSHFSDSFRAAFGVPPSLVRDDGRRILRRFARRDSSTPSHPAMT
jgi:AraC-like DNA-binding protein